MADTRVTQLTDPIGSTDPVFPSEGGPPIQDERTGARDIAIAIGVALVSGEGLKRLVRSRRPD